MLIFTQIEIFGFSVHSWVVSADTTNSIISKLSLRPGLYSWLNLDTTQVFAKFENHGLLSNTVYRNSNLPLANYISTILPTNSTGTPLSLLILPNGKTSLFQTTPISIGANNVRVFYVIDRVCAQSGTADQAVFTNAVDSQTINGTSGMQHSYSTFSSFFRLSLLASGFCSQDQNSHSDYFLSA
jgi:hypothetical protein